MELPSNLTTEQQRMYDDAAQIWQDLREGLATAQVNTGAANKDLWKAFWAGQQRFFKLLCVAMKVGLQCISMST